MNDPEMDYPALVHAKDAELAALRAERDRLVTELVEAQAGSLRTNDDRYEQGRRAAFGLVAEKAQGLLNEPIPRAFSPHVNGQRAFAYELLDYCQAALKETP